MAYSGTVGTTVINVYIVTNVVNGKQYVGITSNLNKRWNKHKNAMGSAPALHAAIKKYGLSSFVFTHFADAFDDEAAKKIEIMLIDDLKTLAPRGYNLTSGGDGTFKPSDEVRKKMSISHMGKVQSDKTKEKRSQSLKIAYAEGRHKGNSGNSFTMNDESKKKISEAKMGKKNPMFGKKQSPELVAKRVAAFAIAIAKRKAVEA
jgi:group I intron endonuclease